MDKPDAETEDVDGGIYGVCPLCWGLTPNLTGHKTWHRSRGEVAPDAHD